MCGIAGFVGSGNEQTLEKMIMSIRHRGPDSQDCILKENVGFAHARLSIIDLSVSANQPFFNTDKSLMMVFNGEIYNYQSLKEKLLQTGRYRFQTNGDTEVLLYLYQEFGLEMLNDLNGMFAFAVYDFNKQELVLVRDRMGKKPLYYGVFGETLLFGSELKALLSNPLAKRNLNFEALNQYLTFDYVPTTQSIIENIHKLEGGQYLKFKSGAIQEKAFFWRANFTEQNISSGEAENTFENLLDDATRLRMIADVPLGVFLSGGLDSSAVAYFAQKNSNVPVKTFSIGFEEKSYNEADYAQRVAERLGTEHYVQFLKAKESIALFHEIAPLLDEPFADASIIPTYYLSKFTRQQVTVALGGDGSDELLAGYPTFYSDYFSPYLSVLPKPLIGLMQQMAKLLPVSDGNISLDFKIKQFLKGFELQKPAIHSLWLGSFSPATKHTLFSSETKAILGNKTGLELAEHYWNELPQNTDFQNTLYTYYRSYLQDDILVKVDRASMYTSLEVRAPFLDYRIVDFLSTLPKPFKRQGANGKVILKNVMRGKIPDDIIDRPKKGFGLPLVQWLREDLRGLCQDLLSPEKIRQQGIFDANFVQKIQTEHYSKKQNHRKLLWNLMMFQLWYDNYMR